MSIAKKWGDFDFATEVQAAVHQGPRLSLRIFLFTIVAMLAAAIFWADRAMVDEVTRGEGKVIPSSEIQVVQSLEGGIIQEILVDEGQLVEEGEILLRIDDTGFASSRGELEAQRMSLAAQMARLEAEVSGATELTFPPELMEEAPEVAAGQIDLFQARQATLENQLSILRQQAGQREQELQELQNEADQAESSLSLAQQELNIYLPLAQTGVVPEVEMLRLRREVNDLRGQLEAARLAIPRAESAIREAYEKIEDQFLTFRSEAQFELNQRRGELAVIQQSLTAATARVTRANVRAPVTGIVNTVSVSTVGQVVQPGASMVEIVPVEDTLRVEARIRPSDVAFIRPGQTATVKLTAYDYSIYGGLKGEIERISADTILDEETGESFYHVTVRTERNTLGTEENPLPIIPGMIATVDILTGEKSILDYLLKPLNKARSEALRER